MLMAEILRPSLVLLRRSTPSSAKKRQRLPEAVGVEVWQPDRHECPIEHDTDRTGAAPVLAVQSGHFEPKGALRGWRLDPFLGWAWPIIIQVGYATKTHFDLPS